MTEESLDSLLEHILNQYQQAFAEKILPEESTEEDDLMLAFGLTQAISSRTKVKLTVEIRQQATGNRKGLRLVNIS